MKENIPVNTSPPSPNEDEVDSCCCQLHEIEELPDEDLPVSVGGVE